MSKYAICLFSILLIGILCIAVHKSETDKEQIETEELHQNNESIVWFETPVSYENKQKTSFKVFQVLWKDVSLANEISDYDYNLYYGTTVVLIGENFYDDQIVNVNFPQIIGTLRYTNKIGTDNTAPIIITSK